MSILDSNLLHRVMSSNNDVGENRRVINGVPVFDSSFMLQHLPDAQVIYVVLGDFGEPVLAFDTLEDAVRDAASHGTVVCLPLKEREKKTINTGAVA